MSVTQQEIQNFKNWLKVIFDPEELVWFTFDVTEPTQATSQKRLLALLYEAEWIEAPETQSTKAGLKIALNPANWERSYWKGENVKLCRNLMFEYDGGNARQQFEVIQKSGLPYTSITFSGNKSLHIIVSLVDPIPYDDFKPTWKKIQKILDSYCGSETECDPATSSKVQWCRAPIFTRVENGVAKKQQLVETNSKIELNSRIENSHLETWIQNHRDIWFVEPRTQTKIFRPNSNKFLKLISDYFGVYDPGQYSAGCPVCIQHGKDRKRCNLSIKIDEEYPRIFCHRECDFKEILTAITQEGE